MLAPRVRYAKRGGFNLAYQVVGEGPLDLVLSPGWVTHLELAWEVPGLARFLRRLSSFSRLILFDSRGRMEPTTGLLARIAGTTEAALDRLEREWATESVGVALWAPSLVGDDQAVPAYLRLLRSGASPGSARVLVQAGYRVDCEAVLPAVHVPTLVPHRTGDLVVPVGQGRRMAERIPGATFTELPGVDHLMWVGDQDAVIEQVQAFLARPRPAADHNRRLVTVLGLLGAHRPVVRANLAIRCADAIINATRPLGLQGRAAGSGIGFGDRGAHALEGIQGDWELFGASLQGGESLAAG